MNWAKIRNMIGLRFSAWTNSCDQGMAAEIGEDRGEGARADEQEADHGRGAAGQIDRLAQPVPGQRAVGGGQHDRAERADRRRFRRRREPEHDGAEHRQDQHREREEGGEQRAGGPGRTVASVSSSGSFGASDGLMMARPTT